MYGTQTLALPMLEPANLKQANETASTIKVTGSVKKRTLNLTQTQVKVEAGTSDSISRKTQKATYKHKIRSTEPITKSADQMRLPSESEINRSKTQN